MILLLLALLAAAQEPEAPPPTCSTADLATLTSPGDRLAVAWVGPWHRRPTGSVSVVAVDDLNTWIRDQDPPWRGRTLQWLGLRKRNTDPSRRFKVMIFDVDAAALCRPVTDIEKGTLIADVPACAPRHGDATRKQTGCGRTLDRRTGEPGALQFVVKAREARRSGWCAVPLHRYLQDVSGKEVP